MMKNIPMSDWEIHDFAIQIVTPSFLEWQLQRSSSQPTNIDPSILFRDQHGPAYVIVRAADIPSRLPTSLRMFRTSHAHVRDLTTWDTLKFHLQRIDLDEPLFRGHGTATLLRVQAPGRICGVGKDPKLTKPHPHRNSGVRTSEQAPSKESLRRTRF